MIYDCFLFFNENDLLEVRLNQHNKFVDKFSIVEAAETHTGIKKDLCFDHKRFERFSDKIIYRSIHSFEDEIKKNPNLISQNISNFITPQKQLNHQDWIRDNFQAEYITKTLLEQNPNQEDIVLFSCLDEILNEEAFIECLSVFSTNQKFFLKSKIFNKYVLEKKVDPVFSFVLDTYAYKLNLFHKQVPVGTMTKVSNLAFMKWTELRYFACTTHEFIENAGWHFTFLDNTDGEKALMKYKSWAHSKDISSNRKRYFDIQTKEEAVNTVFKDYNLKKVNITKQSYPKFIIENLEFFSDYIYK